MPFPANRGLLRLQLSLLLALVTAASCLLTAPTATAQAIGVVDADMNLIIENVAVTIVNPSKDAAVNARAEDVVRRALSLFPGQRYSEERVAFAISVARRNADLGAVVPKLSPGRHGGVDVDVSVELVSKAQAAAGRGYFFTKDPADLPTLYDNNGTVLRYRLDFLTMYYSNGNAWYGRPDLMLAGNPLVQGTPAGAGYTAWVESYLHYGLYGITPLSDSLYVYGGLSAITSVSVGQELFTDWGRTYTGVEDAYVGLITGNTDDTGNRLVFNLTAGRQRFTLANAFLIANTAANGQDRAGLQSNARWAADNLVLGQVAYNRTKFEAFYVDPDELPILDTGTVITGVNLELQPVNGLTLAGSWLTVPHSTQSYFGPTGTVVGTREGMELADLRFTYQPNAQGTSGFYFGGEYATQRNRNFDMNANAAYGEVGYAFADAKWTPEVSFRLSYFSGDDPTTTAYERWDPLLSGGNGEQWVQGANHFKVVQDANVIAQRLQMRLRVAPKVELVPQFWVFKADTLNNIGGNPALTFLSDDDYGSEANITVKWFASRKLYVHGQLAYTMPGQAVVEALDGTEKNWWSAMVFMRYAF